MLDARDTQPRMRAEMVERMDGTEGIDGEILDFVMWEELRFNMGPGRLEVNEDSWNEHLDFRRAVAYALDRDRVAEAAFGFSWPGLDSYLDVYSSSLSLGGWDRYPYDPDRARDLLEGLCADLGRDCAADQPTLVWSPLRSNPHRAGDSDQIAT